ncbi:MAG: hypothetical protein Kapaf2KO_05720 [Candidatus Kapaibacteriales bacterium]
MDISPKYETDIEGNKIVILLKNEYDKLISKLFDLKEELEDIKDYHKAVADDDGKRYTIEEVFGNEQ